MTSFAGYTYNPKKKRWINLTTGQIALLGNRLRMKNGDYILLNSNGTTTKVGSVSEGLSKEYIALKKKLGLAVNIKAEDAAMRNGLIKDRKTGKWRLDTESKIQTRNENGRSYYRNNKGRWINFDTGLELKADLDRVNKDIEKRSDYFLEHKDDSLGDAISNLGIVSGLTDWGLKKLGVDNEYVRGGASLLASGLYSVPIAGLVLGLTDAVLAGLSGNYGNMATTAALAFIPGGRILKTTKQLATASKLGNLANKTKLTSKIGSKIGVRTKPVLEAPTAAGSTRAEYLAKLQAYNNAVREWHTLSPAKYFEWNKLSHKGIKVNDKVIKTLQNSKLPIAGAGIIYQSGIDQNKAMNKAIEERANLNEKIFSEDIKKGLIFGRYSNEEFNKLMKDHSKSQLTPEDYLFMRRLNAYTTE